MHLQKILEKSDFRSFSSKNRRTPLIWIITYLPHARFFWDCKIFRIPKKVHIFLNPRNLLTFLDFLAILLTRQFISELCIFLAFWPFLCYESSSFRHDYKSELSEKIFYSKNEKCSERINSCDHWQLIVIKPYGEFSNQKTFS